MIDYLFRLMFGWVEVLMSGHHAERMINDLILSGYRIWKVEYQGDKVYFVMTLSGVRSLQELTARYGVEVNYRRRGGVPVFWRRARKRPFLLIGALVALALLKGLSAHLWVIDTPGYPANAKERHVLLMTAQRSGLHLGEATRHLNLHQIRASMLKQLPQYSWIGIDVHGVVASLHFIKVQAPPKLHVPHRLVASRAGKITKVLVYIGDPEVAVGDYVKKGQTLINGVVSGTQPSAPEGSPVPKEIYSSTPAEGQVWAHVLYRTKIFEPLMAEKQKQTSRTWTQRFLLVQDLHPVQLTGFGKVPFSHYTWHRQSDQIYWAGVNLPLEMLKIVYNETKLKNVKNTRRQMLREASLRADSIIKRDLSHGSTIVKRRKTILWGRKGVWVTYIWTVNQEISKALN